MSDVRVRGLFPTPFMQVSRLLSQDVVAACVAHIESAATRTNARSELLRHTDITEPASEPYGEVCTLIEPHLQSFGELLFGERLPWAIKEIWTNLLITGGHQAVHAHSNSFISGIVYLTDSHPAARTVFHRNLGGREFLFSNDNPRAHIGEFNGNKWVAPETRPGDLVLYPSYLLHEVPVNPGGARMTIAFNAIPERLDTWGYAIRFTSHRSGD